MTRAYKITRLPDGYCKVAVAAWKALSDRELFEIEGKLVFTDDLESYIFGRFSGVERAATKARSSTMVSLGSETGAAVFFGFSSKGVGPS